MTSVLSQDEIDQLLAAINAGDTEPENFIPAKDSRKIKIYDFKRPDRFSRWQIRNLSILHDRTARLWAALSTQCFQTDIYINVASVDQLTHEEYTRSIPTPTTLIIAEGICNNVQIPFFIELEIDPDISAEMLYYLFRGKPRDNEKVVNKNFLQERTLLERAAMSYFGKLLFEKYSQVWQEECHGGMKFHVKYVETNPQYIVDISPQETVLLVLMEAKINHVEGMINICLPYPFLELFLYQFSGYKDINYCNKYLHHEKTKIPKHIKDSIQLIFHIEYFREIVNYKDILNIREGEIFYLRKSCEINQCKIIADNYVFFTGEIITDYSNPNNRHQIKINKIVNQYKECDFMTDRDVSTIETGLDKLKVQLIVELDRTVKTIKEISEVTEGTIMKLDKFSNGMVDIFVNNVLFARGEVVAIDDQFGVRFVEIIDGEPVQPQASSEEEPVEKNEEEANRV
jgi:flagellar motor switch protein FliM